MNDSVSTVTSVARTDTSIARKRKIKLKTSEHMLILTFKNLSIGETKPTQLNISQFEKNDILYCSEVPPPPNKIGVAVIKLAEYAEPQFVFFDNRGMITTKLYSKE